MSFDKFLLAVESRDLSQADKSIMCQTTCRGPRLVLEIWAVLEFMKFLNLFTSILGCI